MAHSKYYDEDRNSFLRKSIDDATPEEWDRASQNAYQLARELDELARDVSLTLEQEYQNDGSWLEFNGYNDSPTSITFTEDFNPRIEYKFREDQLIEELRLYIDKTYDQHYAGGKIQATEDIIDDGHGTGFCIGNAKKYLKRYGKKGETPAEWRKDIIKVLHYGLIQLYIHDLEHGNNTL